MEILLGQIWKSSKILDLYYNPYCQAPGPGLDKPGPQPGQLGHQLGQT